MNKKLFKPLTSGDSKTFYEFIRENRENDSSLIPDLKHGTKEASSPAQFYQECPRAQSWDPFCSYFI